MTRPKDCLIKHSSGSWIGSINLNGNYVYKVSIIEGNSNKVLNPIAPCGIAKSLKTWDGITEITGRCTRCGDIYKIKDPYKD